MVTIIEDSKVINAIAGLIKLKNADNVNNQPPTSDEDINKSAQELVDRYEALNGRMLQISDITSQLVEDYGRITDITDKLVKSKENNTNVTNALIDGIDNLISNFDALRKNMSANADILNDDIIHRIETANRLHKSLNDPAVLTKDIEKHIRDNRTAINRTVDGFFENISNKFRTGLRTITEVITLPKTIVEGMKKTYNDVKSSWGDFKTGLKTGDFSSLFMSKEKKNEELTLGISRKVISWHKIKQNSVTGVAISELIKELKRNGSLNGNRNGQGDTLLDSMIEGGTEATVSKMLTKILTGASLAKLLAITSAVILPAIFTGISVAQLGTAIDKIRQNDVNKKSPSEVTGKSKDKVTELDKTLNDMFQGTFGNRGSGTKEDRYKNGTKQAWNLGWLGAGLGAIGGLAAAVMTGGLAVPAALAMTAGGAALGGMIGSGVGAAGGYVGGDDLAKGAITAKDKAREKLDERNARAMERRNELEDSMAETLKRSKKETADFNKNIEKANKETFPSFFSNIGSTITSGITSIGKGIIVAGKNAIDSIKSGNVSSEGRAPRASGLGLGLSGGIHIDKNGKIIQELAGNASKYNYSFDIDKYREVLKSRGSSGKDLERQLKHAKGLFDAATELKNTKYPDLDVGMMMNQAILESGNFKSSLTDSLNPWGAKVSKSKLLAPLQNGSVNKHNNIEGGNSNYGTYANWSDSATWWYLRTKNLKKDDPATYVRELKQSQYYGASLDYYTKGLYGANNLGIITKKLKKGVQEKTRTLFSNLSEAATMSLQSSFDKTDSIAYKNGSKSWKNGRIDCSGWVGSVTGALFDDINAITGSQTFDKKAKSLLGTSSNNIVSGIAKATGQLITNPKVKQLKEGMIIGLDANDTRGKGLGVKSIDHVAMVAKDKKGNTVIRESSSGVGKDGKTGVQETEINKWMARQAKLGRDTFAVDPMLLADSKYRSTLVARGVAPSNITAVDAAKKEAEAAAANKKAEAQTAKVTEAFKKSAEKVTDVATAIKERETGKTTEKTAANTNNTMIASAQSNNEIPKHIIEFMFGLNIGGEKILPSMMA